MKLNVADNFLSRGSMNIPNGAYKAVGIHCSSEVDAIEMGGIRVGARSVIPLGMSQNGGQLVTSARKGLNGRYTGLTGGTEMSNANQRDGVRAPGEKLVLQLYEECDDLNPPGPRVPYLTSVLLPTLSAAGATTAATAMLVSVLPMSNRLRAVLSFGANLNGASYGLRGIRESAAGDGMFYVDKAAVVLPNTPSIYAAAGAIADPQCNIVYVDNESFDWLLVYMFSAGAPNGLFSAEVDGDRIA